jgi:DNA-binding response OmpR family regulator
MTERSQTVLVVSDRPPLSPGIACAFPDDVTVLFAIDATEAMQLMSEISPSVVVADIRTGNAGGYGLSREMAANERLREIPRLILLERRQDSWLARQAGATRYRVMPISGDELVEEVLLLASKVAAPTTQ